MSISAAALIAIIPELANAQAWADSIQAACTRYQINTDQRLAAFLAQIIHESAHFTAMVENLNYSAQGLLATFPRYFSASDANAYQRQPERIANRAYASRMGNGDEASGDGWMFRGRGLIQLTGREMHQNLATALGMQITDMAAYLATPDGAAMSAAWFWQQHGLNELADGDQFTNITMRINGGTNGLPDRKAIWAAASAALKANPYVAPLALTTPDDSTPVLAADASGSTIQPGTSVSDSWFSRF